MRLAIMQPYFLPYIGYYQLIASADVFVVYDDIKYTKKGWINRNRMLINGAGVIFSLPLKKGSDFLSIVDRRLAADFNRERLLNQIKSAYRSAPYFAQTFQLVAQVVRHDDENLFRFLHHSIVKTCEHLGIATEIRISSAIAIDPDLKSQEKVLALCEAIGATTYINAIGGMDLYSKDAFLEKSVELQFIQSQPFEFPQFGDAFVPWLSIIDVMMFNSIEEIQRQLTRFDLH